jgi:hypothetical protein
MSGDDCSGSADPVLRLAVAGLALLSAPLDDSRDRKVGRLGVDFDWKPVGTGGGIPLLWGGISMGLTSSGAHRKSFRCIHRD